MAGRGCVIKVQITRNAAETSSPEEISLQVALHSPLEVLKLQLQQMTRISLQSQVLILLDLSDADRNSDRLLEHEQNHITLRNLGIRQNSVLSLHSLGAMKNDATAEEVDSSDGVKEKVFSLSTLIPASRADHSYNGVIFNIASKGAFEVTIKSIHLAGMLSMVRIFARDRAWDMRRDDEAPSFSGHWWAHRENVSSQGWKEVAAQVCSPSWDRPTEIKFHTPVTLLPHEVLGFYCHSALPDDLGIQYQSFVKDGVVAEDDVIRVTPGVGHTGSVPFDETNGWYRAYRGPAGSFSYTCRLKGWSPFTHKIFPQPFRHSVKELLLVNNRVCKQNLLSSLPPFVLYYIMEFAHWDWFCEAAGNRKLLGHSRVTPNSAVRLCCPHVTCGNGLSCVA